MSSAINERQGQQSDVPAAKNPAEPEEQAVKPASEKKKAEVQATNAENPSDQSVPDKEEQADVEQQKEPDASSTVSPEVATPVEQTVTGTSEAAEAVAKEDPPAAEEVEEDEEPEEKEQKKKAASPESDYPVPSSLNPAEEFIWNEDADAVDNYVKLGEKLAAGGDLYRNTAYAGGLLLASNSKNVPPKPILDGRALAAVIVDRIRVRVQKGNTTIRPEELYTLEALKNRLGIRDATLRSARRAGLPVHYKHGRGFVRGADWINYVCKAEPQIPERDSSDKVSSNLGSNSEDHGPTVDCLPGHHEM